MLNRSNEAITRDSSAILPSPSTAIDSDWLSHFYKECGREVTLAYSTLNQMKNWAMIIAGAVISGVSFGQGSLTYPNESMFIGIIIALAFTLRFFVRAILCYINLIRWNSLQSSIVRMKLVGSLAPDSAATETPGQLIEVIQNLYFDWRSPIGRKGQILANLKLGFSLLFFLLLFFAIWGAVALWQSHLVQGLCAFILGYTLVEMYDFITNAYFDTKEASAKSSARRERLSTVFPIPVVGWGYFVLWSMFLLLSLLVAFRDQVVGFIRC
jgi:hypothetical protein